MSRNSNDLHVPWLELPEIVRKRATERFERLFPTSDYDNALAKEKLRDLAAYRLLKYFKMNVAAVIQETINAGKSDYLFGSDWQSWLDAYVRAEEQLEYDMSEPKAANQVAQLRRIVGEEMARYKKGGAETMSDLDAEQQLAVEAGENTLVLAGPGAGKTKTLEAKAHREVRAGNCVRIMTFTVSAAEEIRERLGDLPVAFIGTLHAFALKLMHEAGYGRELCDDETFNAIKEEVIATSRIKLTKRRRKELFEGAPPLGPIEKLFIKSVQQTIDESGFVTYDGILETATQVLATGLQTRYKGAGCVYLIDEIQDSGKLDLALYEALMRAQAHVWMVGDLQQKIFSFRSTYPADIWQWADGLPVCRIATNYRSSQKVVECCNLINARFEPRVEGRAAPGAVEGGVYSVVSDSVAEMLGAICRCVVGLEKYEQTAVLCRTNSECAQVVQEMGAREIPVRTRAGSDFKERVPAILWAALSVYMRPESDWRMRRLLQLTDWNEEEAKTATKKLQSLAQRFYPMLLAIERDTERWPQCMNLLGVPKSEQSWFYERVGKDWQLSDWNEIFLRLYESPAADEQGEGVTVLTVHSAKGREWRHVLLAYCDTQSYREADSEDERVFFVGASRAIETLGFYCSRTRQSPWSRELLKVNPSKSLRRLIEFAATRTAHTP